MITYILGLFAGFIFGLVMGYGIGKQRIEDEPYKPESNEFFHFKEEK